MKKYGCKLGLLCSLTALVISGCQLADRTETAQTTVEIRKESAQAETSQAEISQAKTSQTETVQIAETQKEAEIESLSSEEEKTQIYENLDWDKMLGETILKANADYYPGYECVAEGHIILDTKLEDHVMTVYALTMYGEYQFHNENQFVKSAGSGVIPCVLEFMVNAKGSYKTKAIHWPTDGAGYVESIHELFPEELWDACITPSEENKTELIRQEQRDAQEYLEDIEREAQIGDYADFEYVLMTELGVSVEASNALLEEEKWIGNYPSWVGTMETLEDGIRYVFERAVDAEAGKIVLMKTEYGSEEPVECYEFDWQTGERLYYILDKKSPD